MSWLYNHREQLDGLYPFARIAFFAVVSRIPPEDQDDVEQEIVILLMEIVKKHGGKPQIYLEKAARNRVYKYFIKKSQERERLRYIFEDGKGEIIRRLGEALRPFDARMDAIATLDTLPERLIQIGHKILDGEKLSGADLRYRKKHKAKLRPKLNCPRCAFYLSDWEKRRILRLHSEGMSLCKIARTMGRSTSSVKEILVAGGQPLSRMDWLAKTKAAAKVRDEQIRHEYFVEGKTALQIAREFHYGHHIVYKAIRSGAGTD